MQCSVTVFMSALLTTEGQELQLWSMGQEELLTSQQCFAEFTPSDGETHDDGI